MHALMIHILRQHRELVFSLLCGSLLLGAWLYEWLGPEGVSRPLVVYATAYVFGGYDAFVHMIRSLRKGAFDIDFLMLVAAAGAAILGAWAEGALLLFLFSLGHALEHYAMGRARKAISALADIAPVSAIIRTQQGEQQVPVEVLAPGDVVIVRPGERLPADGWVIAGRSSVDQSPITGESVPVDKEPVGEPYHERLKEHVQSGSQDASSQPTASAAPLLSGILSDARFRIFAGTINGEGVLEVLVRSRSADTTLARVIRMVRDAESGKSPTQRFAERFERVFVPVILTGVVLLHFAWLVIDEPFSDSFYRAMAVLVAASPCALAISTPSAILSGIARAARLGVLVKGGRALEQLGGLRALAFDKTGTLTMGEPEMVEVVVLEGFDQTEVLRLAAGIEQRSSHPLATAIVKGALRHLNTQALPQSSDVEMIPGKGIAGQVDGKKVVVGQSKLFDSALPPSVQGTLDRMQKRGYSTILVQVDGMFSAVIGMVDQPRPGAAAVLNDLRNLGIRRIVMLSGDHSQVAREVGRRIGLEEVWGDLLPEDKVASLRRLLAEEHQVAMVGDGVNDAPAMANATVGIAMGAAGSDVALETADVALMADDLSRLPVAVALSRATRRIIRQNIFISLGMIAFLVPFVLFGYAGIGVAVLLHEGSTLLVVLNALRLLRFEHTGV